MHCDFDSQIPKKSRMEIITFLEWPTQSPLVQNQLSIVVIYGVIMWRHKCLGMSDSAFLNSYFVEEKIVCVVVQTYII